MSKCFSADLLDLLKTRACGCFVAGIRRGLLAKEVVLVENGAVYVHNFHLPVRFSFLFSLTMSARFKGFFNDEQRTWIFMGE